MHFIDWLRNIESNEIDGVRFAVFGCGNSDWTATFQKIPILCDGLLEKHGGHRLLARGWGDASSADFFQMFDEFEANLWAVVSEVSDVHSCGELTLMAVCRSIRRRGPRPFPRGWK